LVAAEFIPPFTVPLSISNISGQNVMNFKGQGEQRINISALPFGTYIIRTASGDVARFVKTL
jgi:hypothetical protein